MEIYDLDSGTTYQVRVVSKNGEGYESPSEWQEVKTAGVGTYIFIEQIRSALEDKNRPSQNCIIAPVEN